MRIIESHTGLRGIAALLVVVYHLQFGATTLLPIETITELPQRSYLFVDLFFALSGFIISYTANEPFTHGLRRSVFFVFIIRRLIRLYPLLLFTLLYFVGFAALETMICKVVGRPSPVLWDPASWSALAAQAFMVNAWLHSPSAWNVASWSISAEVAAYLLFPFAVALLSRFFWAGVATMLACSLAFYIYVALTTGSLDIIAGLAPARAIAGFLLGMLIFRARTLIAEIPLPALCCVQTVAVSALLLTLCVKINDVWVMAPIIALVATTQHDRGPLSYLLKHRVLQWLGKISYSVYLNHICVGTLLWIPFLAIAKRILKDPTLIRACWIGTDIISVLIVSHYTWRLVEVPARTWLTRAVLGSNRRPRDAAVASP